MFKRYALYLVRWQLSTPILAVVLMWLASWPAIWATVVANLIGGLIFFWVDQFIFKKVSKDPVWEIREDTVCADCGHEGTGYRVVEWLGYHRSDDPNPQFRCDECRRRKLAEIEQRVKK